MDYFGIITIQILQVMVIEGDRPLLECEYSISINIWYL